MNVIVEATTPCGLCGYRIYLFQIGTARVNKRSIRVRGPLLGAIRYPRCPECGWDVCSDGLRPRSVYTLAAEDAAKVAACRMRKWGVESAVGVLVEAEAERGEAA